MISSEVTNLLKECFEKRTLLAWQGSFKFSDQLKSAGLAVHLGLNIFLIVKFAFICYVYDVKYDLPKYLN